MDLVNIMYKYINKLINSDEVIKELTNIDYSKYSLKEQDIIKKLLADIKASKENILNEEDEVEREHKRKIEELLNTLDKAINKGNIANDDLEMLEKQKRQLLKDKNEIRDGGKLYETIFELLTKNSLVNKYAKKMNDEELLDFIAQYIKVPLPPNLSQQDFDDLVKVGIKKDKREALWRLAFNYNGEGIDFSLIEDYFIEKRDDYYLVELIHAVKDDLNIPKLLEKIKNIKDNDFINRGVKRAIDTYLVTEEKAKELGFVINW